MKSLSPSCLHLVIVMLFNYRLIDLHQVGVKGFIFHQILHPFNTQHLVHGFLCHRSKKTERK